ncbi:hypothetical protein OC842_004286 [Tilletia horrida]|uniref:NADAR domain-containing protein n=1 Tax=Tilletia horrida TaxID=155126 RepID=A0AAN6G9Y7_9BASI|nr:hypothetical protein OC842_004286 [Tilletia horrida]
MTAHKRCNTPSSMDEGENIMITPAASASTSAQTSRIRFYSAKEPFFFLTNFASSRIFHDGNLFRNAEILYQASKFAHMPDLYWEIVGQDSPRAAFNMAQKYRSHVSKDWEARRLQVMGHVQLLKYTQNSQLRARLLQTGNAELIEASPHDAFWGDAADGKGKNQLGKILMSVRDRLRGWSHDLQLPPRPFHAADASSSSSLVWRERTERPGIRASSIILSPAIELLPLNADVFLHGIAYDEGAQRIELIVQVADKPGSEPGRPSVNIMKPGLYPSSVKGPHCSLIDKFCFSSPAFSLWSCKVDFPPDQAFLAFTLPSGSFAESIE